MYVLADDRPGSDWDEVMVLLEDDDDDRNYPMQSYICIEEHEGSGWLAEMIESFWEVPQVLGALDPSMLAAQERMHRLLRPGLVPPRVLAADVHRIGRARLLKGYSRGVAHTLERRPSIRHAARCRPLQAEETQHVLGLPPAIERQRGLGDGTTNIIGTLARQPGVPLAVSRHLYPYHFLIAGATGAIKSNVAANICAQGAYGGRAVIIHDRKLDYWNISEPNRDPNPLVLEAWERFAPYGLQPRAAPDVVRYRVWNGEQRAIPGVRLLGFRSSDFDPDVFAGLFFDDRNPSNELALDGLATICQAMRDEQTQQGQRHPRFDLDDILARINAEDQGDARSGGQRNPNGLLHAATASKLRRAVGSARRRFPWLDAVGTQLVQPRRGYGADDLEHGGDRVQAFDFEDVVQPGRITLIDYNSPTSATYGVIASYLFEAGQAYRTRLASQNQGPGLVQLFDEAHLIFSTSGRHGAGLARVFGTTLVQARSKDHCVIVALQNVTVLPHEVRNNLNSDIILKQGDRRMADIATEKWGKDYGTVAMALEKGDGLVAYAGMSKPVLASLAPSPFELQRSDLPDELDEEGNVPFVPHVAAVAP